MSWSYDEDYLLERIQLLDRAQRTVYAACCAEWLWPLVERFGSEDSVSSETVPRLRKSLNDCWDASKGLNRDIQLARVVAEQEVPDEEDPAWTSNFAYAQNGISAIAYTARSWLTGESLEAVWAARQVYEAADYVAALGDSAISIASESGAADDVTSVATSFLSEALEMPIYRTEVDLRAKVMASATSVTTLFHL